MIKSVMIVNNQGKPRLTRFYVNTPLDMQRKILTQAHHIVSRRSDDLCCCFATDPDDPGWKIVYRHYATLYFIFIIDEAESELGILDLLQVFVQVLDACFENVCELDLIYHFDKVNYILDELVMAGMVLETNVDSVLHALNEARKIENDENSFWGFELPAAISALKG